MTLQFDTESKLWLDPGLIALRKLPRLRRELANVERECSLLRQLILVREGA